MDTNSPDANLASEPQLRFGKIDGLFTRVSSAIAAARNLLFSAQHEDGYWCGELEADTTLESDYILLHTLLGTGNAERFRKAANWIVQHQNEDGGWSIYAGGTVKRQRFGQGLLWVETGRLYRRSSGFAARPQKDPRTRRSH